MIKKEYKKPATRVVMIQHHVLQMLSGSVTSITTTGLDDSLILPPGGLPALPGSPWKDAW